VEQHGHHLPLDVDLVCPTGIATGAGKEIPSKLLVLPIVAYGYTGHVMDFPGTINNDFEHFMHHVLDITKSLAYHGFKKIVLLNGHGSNMPNLDLAARRTNIETDAECVCCAWWNLLTVDKAFLPRWRQSKFPGGCAHACELETSLYLYLDGDNVRKDRVENGDISFNLDDSPFNWVDLFGAGPATVISWTSSYSDTGVLGEAKLATAETGREAYEEAVKQLTRFLAWFKTRPKDERKDMHRRKPTMPFPWEQTSLDG
jgi:creatinine amidohydrolase